MFKVKKAFTFVHGCSRQTSVQQSTDCIVVDRLNDELHIMLNGKKIIMILSTMLWRQSRAAVSLCCCTLCCTAIDFQIQGEQHSSEHQDTSHQQ
jgi:hypothetical protein